MQAVELVSQALVLYDTLNEKNISLFVDDRKTFCDGKILPLTSIGLFGVVLLPAKKCISAEVVRYHYR